MGKDRFFDEPRDQSKVKTIIVQKYFKAWAKVIIPHAKRGSNKIAYIDLFAGPGRYEDGTQSTPLQVLEASVKDSDLQAMLVSIFNDKDEKHCKALEKEILKIPGIEKLKYKPVVNNEEVGEKIIEFLENTRLIPSLFFIDPWGYKGLSLRLVNSALKDWGCDCIFFFNYNRISMGLANPAVEEHIEALFGAERGEKLRARLEDLNAVDRELQIIEELTGALKETGGQYVLPFRFKNEMGTRTNQHLIFVSKHVRGYEIMKDIMAHESSKTEQGVPSFEYSPADRRFPLLFELGRPLDDLEKMLLEAFAGKCMVMKQIYDEHHMGRPYIKKNYKKALLQLEEKGQVKTDPPSSMRRKKQGQTTFADDVKVMFPQRGG